MECERCGGPYKMKHPNTQKPLCQKCKNIFNRVLSKRRQYMRRGSDGQKEGLYEREKRYEISKYF